MTNDRLCDVVFKVKDKTFFGVSGIFAAFSPVFEKMLFGSMIESQVGSYIISDSLDTNVSPTRKKNDEVNTNNDNEGLDDDDNDININATTSSDSRKCVVITDVEPKAFEFLQQYIYLQKPLMNNDLVVDVLYLSQKYLIKDVEKLCLSHIKNVSDINITLLFISTMINKYKMIDESNKLLKKHKIFSSSKSLVKTLKSKNFKYLPFSMIEAILKSDILHIKEEIIWQKCVQWAKFRSDTNSNVDDVILPQTQELKQDIDFEEKLQLDDINNNNNNNNDSKSQEQELQLIDIPLNNCKNPKLFEEYLKRVIPYIRFPMMNKEYFVTRFCQDWNKNYKYLTKDEVLTILYYFCAPNASNMKGLRFSAIRRMSSAKTVPFRWDIHCDLQDSYIAQSLKDSNNRKIKTNSKCMIALSSSVGWDKGKHEFSIKINSIESKWTNGGGIGVLTNPQQVANCSKWIHSCNQYGYVYFVFQSGTCYNGGKAGYDYFSMIPAWSSGQTVKVILDCDNWTIQFAVNNDVSKKHAIEKGLKYHPVLCVRCPCEMTLEGNSNKK